MQFEYPLGWNVRPKDCISWPSVDVRVGENPKQNYHSWISGACTQLSNESAHVEE